MLDAEGKEVINDKTVVDDPKVIETKTKEEDSEADLTSMTLEQSQAEIKRLRKENASRRTANKDLDGRLKSMEEMQGKMKQALGIEGDEQSPEEMAQQLQAHNSVLELELGITQLAVQSQIPSEQMEYFSFLFKKRLEALGEGEELDEEALAEVVEKVKASGNANAGKTSTGINSKGPNPKETGNAVTLEQFVKMNSGEKGGLYQKNPGLYSSLFEEAKTKRML